MQIPVKYQMLDFAKNRTCKCWRYAKCWLLHCKAKEMIARDRAGVCRGQMSPVCSATCDPRVYEWSQHLVPEENICITEVMDTNYREHNVAMQFLRILQQVLNINGKHEGRLGTLSRTSNYTVGEDRTGLKKAFENKDLAKKLGAGHSSCVNCVFVYLIPCRIPGFIKCCDLKMSKSQGILVYSTCSNSYHWFLWIICGVNLLIQGVWVEVWGWRAPHFGIASRQQGCQSVSLHSGSRISLLWVLSILFHFLAEETTSDLSPKYQAL